MAAKESDPRIKSRLLELAQQFDVLATKRDEFLELQEQISTKRDWGKND